MNTGLDQAKINSPFESSENTSGARGTARVAPTGQQSAEEDGEGDEAGEPEEHGEGLDGQDGELVGRAGEEPGREGEVDEGEEGPERGEDEEVVLRGGVQAWKVVIVVPVRDCGETNELSVAGLSLCLAVCYTHHRLSERE